MCHKKISRLRLQLRLQAVGVEVSYMCWGAHANSTHGARHQRTQSVCCAATKLMLRTLTADAANTNSAGRAEEPRGKCARSHIEGR
eukprot:5358976-Pleurochrysis_carterae.AAC.3